MLKIGITGGIGSGKSTICRIFEVLGVPVFDADSVAKSIMHTNRTVVTEIKKLFGEEAYDEFGHLNRGYIASLVFHNAKQLNALNAIVHPATIQAFDAWALEQKTPYVLKEAALLYESNAYKKVDYSVLVVSPEVLRIARVMKRDNYSADQVKARILKQMPDKEKKKLADHVIVNDGKHALIPQVLDLHQVFSNAVE